jgi:hypothetical protein
MTKGFYEIVIGETYRTGLGAYSKDKAKEQIRQLRKQNPSLRRMKLIKVRQ